MQSTIVMLCEKCCRRLGLNWWSKVIKVDELMCVEVVRQLIVGHNSFLVNEETIARYLGQRTRNI